MPIAVFMGLYLRYWRPGKVLECSRHRIRAGDGGDLRRTGRRRNRRRWRPGSPTPASRWRSALIVYGFLASALPVWLLLAPRDYLSTFVKLGVVVLLAVGIFFLRPQLQLPPLTRFVDGTGPIFAGQDFPVLLHHHRLRSGFRISLR